MNIQSYLNLLDGRTFRLSSIAIIGASGYLARAVLRLLERDACVERVVGIDLRPPPFHPSKLEFHPADFRRAPLEALLKGVGTVVHLALDPSRDGDIRGRPLPGTDTLKRLCEAAVEARCRRMLVVGSIAAYGAHEDNPVPIQEWHPLRPNPEVLLSRGWADIERELDSLGNVLSSSLELVRLRTTCVVGPTLPAVRRRRLQQHTVLLPRRLDPMLQLTHEEDMARACQCLIHGGNRAIYHVAGPEPRRLSELYGESGASLIHVPGALARWADLGLRERASLPIPSSWLPLAKYPILVSTEQIRQELGWRPRYTTAEAFQTARAPEG